MKTIDKYSERLKSLIRARLEAVCSVPANWDFNQLLIGYFTIYSRRIENKNTWKLIIQLIVSIATAIATTLGVTSCMGANVYF